MGTSVRCLLCHHVASLLCVHLSVSTVPPGQGLAMCIGDPPGPLWPPLRGWFLQRPCFQMRPRSGAPRGHDSGGGGLSARAVRVLLPWLPPHGPVCPHVPHLLGVGRGVRGPHGSRGFSRAPQSCQLSEPRGEPGWGDSVQPPKGLCLRLGALDALHDSALSWSPRRPRGSGRRHGFGGPVRTRLLSPAHSLVPFGVFRSGKACCTPATSRRS